MLKLDCLTKANVSTLLIWDGDEPLPQGDWINIFWKDYKNSVGLEEISIPLLVEEQADLLKKRLLTWLHELGETHINGKCLIDYLKLRVGFSYWWMTLLAEKSYAKSPRFYDVARLFVLENLIKTNQSRLIIFASHDRVLATTIKQLCTNLGVNFKWHKFETPREQVTLVRRLYRSLPYLFQSMVSFAKYFLQRWPLKKLNKYFSAPFKSEIIFVDYFAHLEKKALTTGKFSSNYWSTLLNSLSINNKATHWLHHYVQHQAVSTSQKATVLIAQFNDNSGGKQRHNFIDGLINLSVICSVLRDYLRLTWINIQLRQIKYHFQPLDSCIDFWPLFKIDWQKSLRGPVAIENCVALNLLEKWMKQLPQQPLGVYLQENQSWEMALIYAWRASNHGKLIGVPHATVRYWDLRYFYDSRSYLRKHPNSLPMPDQVAVNGPVALTAYLDGGYPAGQLTEVEALRYLYLQNKKIWRDRTRAVLSVIRVLICGDMLPAVTHQMISWLQNAADNLPINTKFTLKPHPACMVDAGYPLLQIQMTDAPLVDLLMECDVVFTSNITSASVDAYSFGLPVIQVLDGNTFNMSPLRGLENVTYVTNSQELGEALRNISNQEHRITEEYFYLDTELPRWKKLLSTDIS